VTYRERVPLYSGINKNTRKRSVHRMENYWILNMVLPKVTTGLWRVNNQTNLDHRHHNHYHHILLLLLLLQLHLQPSSPQSLLFSGVSKSVYTHMIGLLVWGISPSKAYSYTVQHKHINCAFTDPCLQLNSNPPPQCPRGTWRRRYQSSDSSNNLITV
jgi:hypothetical protein